MFRLILIIATLMSCSLAYAAGSVYKWTDDTGQVHYRDMPPAHGSDYKVIQKPGAVHHDPNEVMQHLREQVERLDETKAKAQRRQKQTQRQTQEEENCKTAQKNLETLQNSENPVRVDDEGNRTPLSAAERQQALEKNQHWVDAYCL